LPSSWAITASRSLGLRASPAAVTRLSAPSRSVVSDLSSDVLLRGVTHRQRHRVGQRIGRSLEHRRGLAVHAAVQAVELGLRELLELGLAAGDVGIGR
jgi:hypothetical protein